MSKNKTKDKKNQPAVAPAEIIQHNNTKSKNRLTLSIVLITICVILYGNTLTHEYSYDDRMMITENEVTQKGFDGIGEHLNHSFIYGYMHQEGYDAGSSHWRPVTLITYALEIGIWGANEPGNSHLVNLSPPLVFR